MGFAPTAPPSAGLMTPTGAMPVGVFVYPGQGEERDAMTEKFIGYLRLVDACGRPGCPICRCVREASLGHLEALLYEQVTDADTRRTLRTSWGFCNWHTWMLLEVEHSLFGAAIIYEDLVGRARRRFETCLL
jgi:hypothetical protein